MPEIPSPLRRLAVSLAWVTLVAATIAPASAGASYGELGRYGKDGTNTGEFTLSSETVAFGVEQKTGDVYVVDEPDEKTGFRLQKFSSHKGKFEFLASVTFNPKGSDEANTIEGVAIDESLHRLYLLVSGRRGENAKIDPGDEVASEIYAFSTEQEGKTLKPLAGTTNGLLAESKVLRSDSNKYEEALLEPRGIAVEPDAENPSEDRIVIVGSVDTGKLSEDKAPIVHSSLLWVGGNGQLAGKQYIDETEAFEDVANSPVVYDGKVYVEAEEGEIWEIPSSLTGAPKSFSWATPQQQDFWEEQELLELPTTLLPEDGDNLTVSESGVFWSTASIRLASSKNDLYPGAVAFDSTGQEIGWIGGQTTAAGESCAISIFDSPQLAAGSGEELFVLDTQPSKPHLIEFGPEATTGGCPEDTATPPSAALNTTPVEETQPIPINDTVELSSTVTQANVIKVEWNFGDGTSQTVNEEQQCLEELAPPLEEESCETQVAKVEHKFAEAGTLEVTAKIYTDDLAAPVLEKHSKVLIEPNPPVVTTGVPNPIGEHEATLKGTVNPNEWPIAACVFEYGTTEAYGKTVACQPQPSGKSPVTVAGKLESLEKETPYYFRLSVTYKDKGEEKTVLGARAKFTTTGPKQPVVTAEAPSAVGQTTATLRASVNPEGVPIKECFFEYGPTLGYGNTVACSSLPSGSLPVVVTAPISGLSAGSAYHYRAVVVTEASTKVEGKDVDFETEAQLITPPPPPGGGEGGDGGSPGGGGGGGGVASYSQAKIVSVSVSTVSSSGAFTLKLSCPTGVGSCTGTVVLKTAKAVIASVGHTAKAKAVVLTLASGSFAISAGGSKTITLHLSAKGRALLAKSHVIVAKAAISARNAANETATATPSVTLKAAKKKHG